MHKTTKLKRNLILWFRSIGEQMAKFKPQLAYKQMLNLSEKGRTTTKSFKTFSSANWLKNVMEYHVIIDTNNLKTINKKDVSNYQKYADKQGLVALMRVFNSFNA